MGDPARGGKAFRINRPAGLANWRMVHRLINSETIEDRDRIMRGSLAAIGIERGRPFAPDARMEKILVDAGQVGRLMMVNVAFSPRTVPDGVDKQLHPGTRWKNIRLKPSMTEEGPNHGQVTARTIGFHQANGAQLAWDPRDVPPGFGLR